MSTYFGFSDESGDYLKDITAKQLKTHLYYIRATLIMNSAEWKKLNSLFKQLKKDFELPANKEFKWCYLWRLKTKQVGELEIKEKEPYKFLESYSYEKLESFVESCLNLINELDYKKIILTYTDNSLINKHEVKHILKFHIQEIMQRIEMDLQNDYNNLAVLFIDPVSEAKNSFFREIYNELFIEGDFIKDYKHIKDSINIEFSHHSVGIQLADFISGTYSSVLKSKNKGNFKFGKRLFHKYVCQI